MAAVVTVFLSNVLVDVMATVLQLFAQTQNNFARLSVYHAPLEGSTIFLEGSSVSRTPLESSRLAELKYAMHCDLAWAVTVNVNSRCSVVQRFCERAESQALARNGWQNGASVNAL